MYYTPDDGVIPLEQSHTSLVIGGVIHQQEPVDVDSVQPCFLEHSLECKLDVLSGVPPPFTEIFSVQHKFPEVQILVREVNGEGDDGVLVGAGVHVSGEPESAVLLLREL